MKTKSLKQRLAACKIIFYQSNYTEHPKPQGKTFIHVILGIKIETKQMSMLRMNEQDMECSLNINVSNNGTLWGKVEDQMNTNIKNKSISN